MKPEREVYTDGRELPEDVRRVTYAEDQPEYQPLGTVRLPDGTIATRWILSEAERELVARTGEIYLVVMTFNQPLQPLMLMADAPEIAAPTDGPMAFYSRLATLESARAKETHHHALVDKSESGE